LKPHSLFLIPHALHAAAHTHPTMSQLYTTGEGVVSSAQYFDTRIGLLLVAIVFSLLPLCREVDVNIKDDLGVSE